jgi:hypothetical protein
MRQVVNHNLIRRNSIASKAMIFVGLGALVGALILSFTRQELVNLLLIFAFGGTLLSQIGINLFNNWGRHPRIDEILDNALKGFDDRHACFHYLLGVNHALFTPNGVYALIPRFEEGRIEYTDGKWWEDKPRKNLLRRGGRNPIARLESHARSASKALTRAINRAIPDRDDIEVRPILVFLHKDAVVKSNGPIDAVHFKKLKSFLRKRPKDRFLSNEEITLLIPPKLR